MCALPRLGWRLAVAVQVRTPAAVAVWSLLYHSEKSLAVLRSMPVVERIERAEAMLRDKGQGAAEYDYGDGDGGAALLRALANVRVLLLSQAE
jgi:hypothetical protein